MPKRKQSAISDVRDAGKDMTDGGGLDERTGKAVAGGAGGVAGAAGGAAIGSAVGPIGTLIGAIAGAAGGWWAGKNVAEKASGFDAEDDYFKSRFASSTNQRGFAYERARPVYQLGYLASQNPDYTGRSFEEIEPELRRGWTHDMQSQYGKWEDVRGYAGDAFSRGQERVITRAEEELSVGKRPVAAGEVLLRKTVETEHRTERVPVTREEVTIDRRPVDEPRAAGDIDIGEERISVPVTEEEVTVEKRPVVKEEIIVKKHAVEDTETVDADLRKERVEIDDRQKPSRGRKKIDADDQRPRR